MVAVYKIGQSRYNNREDTNGGKFETRLIKSAIQTSHFGFAVCDLNSLDNGNPIDLLFMIAGVDVDERERDVVESIIERSKRKICIVTDALFLNDDRLHLFDELWTQTSSELPIPVRQRYSYVPEMFYDPRTSCMMKQNRVVFAGNAIGREDMIEKYITSNAELAAMTRLLLKTSDSDNRVPYETYQKVLYYSEYSILLDRKSSSDVNWVTPRIVELMNAYTIPLVSKEYDAGFHFISYGSKLRINDASEALEIIKKMDEDRTYLQKEIRDLVRNIAKNRRNFEIMIASELGDLMQ